MQPRYSMLPTCFPLPHLLPLCHSRSHAIHPTLGALHKGTFSQSEHHPSVLVFPFCPSAFSLSYFSFFLCLSRSRVLGPSAWYWRRRTEGGSMKQDEGLTTRYSWRISLFEGRLLNVDRVVVVHCSTFDDTWEYSHHCRVKGEQKNWTEQIQNYLKHKIGKWSDSTKILPEKHWTRNSRTLCGALT